MLPWKWCCLLSPALSWVVFEKWGLWISLCDNNRVNWAVSWINELTILSPPLFCLHSESEVLSVSASVFAILYWYLSILFSVSNVLWCCVWTFWLNLSKCGSAAATWQITGDTLNLLSILVTISFFMKFCNWLSNYNRHLCRHMGLRMSTKF